MSTIHRSAILTLFLVILTGLFITNRVFNASLSIPNTIDEVSWYFHTRSFEVLFLQKDLASREWNGYESYDHPPFAKYLFGTALYLHDQQVFDRRTRLERKWGRWDIYSNSKLEKEGYQDFVSDISAMRRISTIFLIILIFAIGLIVYLVTKRIYAPVILTMLMAINPMIIQNLIRATADSIVTAFMFLSLLSYVRYRQRGTITWLISTGIFSGMAISSKLTGLLALYGIIISEILLSYMSKRHRNQPLKTVFLTVVITLFVWLVVNPTTYPNPVSNTAEYFGFRVHQSAILARNMPDMSLNTVVSRVHAVYCTVISGNCGSSFSNGAMLPWVWVNAIFILLGLWYLFRIRTSGKIHEPSLIVGVHSVVNIVVITLLLPMNWDRYIVPIQISVWVVEICGLNFASGLLTQFFTDQIKPRSVKSGELYE